MTGNWQVVGPTSQCCGWVQFNRLVPQGSGIQLNYDAAQVALTAAINSCDRIDRSAIYDATACAAGEQKAS